MLTNSVSMSLNASQNFFDLRILILEGHSIDECVLSNPIKGLLPVLCIHFDATDGQVFDLGEEIVVWLRHSTFVSPVSFKELHVQSSCLSLFTLIPLTNRGIISIGEGNSGVLRPNELELAVFILLEKLLGEGRLGLRDNRVAGWIIRYEFAEFILG